MLLNSFFLSYCIKLYLYLCIYIYIYIYIYVDLSASLNKSSHIKREGRSQEVFIIITFTVYGDIITILFHIIFCV